MANQEHLNILKQGVETWNQWRKKYPDIHPDLIGADLSDIDLRKADLSEAYLIKANLSGTDLRDVRFYNDTVLGGVLTGTDFCEANLSRANLAGADLTHVNLLGTNLSDANLNNTRFSKEIISNATLTGAFLRDVDLSGVDLSGKDLARADLSGANLTGADLSGANLARADLSGANLNQATLVRTNFAGAILTNCHIYGLAAWSVELKGARQDNLIITPEEEPTITVDNLEIAQFIYLLLNNLKIRDVIDTIARKAVLILGRFTPERKAILDAIREALRTQGYLPIVFDFEKPSSQDLTETVSTLAHLSRFIITDLTDPSCVPYELHVVVPNRMVPVLPLLKETIDPITGKAIPEFAMFRDLRKKYHWVLPIHTYKDLDDLQASLEAKVIIPAEQKAQGLADSENNIGLSDIHTMAP